MIILGASSLRCKVYLSVGEKVNTALLAMEMILTDLAQ